MLKTSCTAPRDRRAATACCLALLSSWAYADTPLESIDTYLNQARDQWQVPGFAVAIVKDDAVVFAKGYGVQESGKEEPIDEDTLFAIASNTKAFTAASLATLVEQGKLSWDDPVKKHLHFFAVYDRYVSDDLRVRDLLCHRSGLGTFSGDLLWYGTSYSTRQVVERARHLGQAGQYGRSYGYNNLMFLAAGEVIAAVSGSPWDEFVRDKILGPLGMTRTLTSTSELPETTNVASPHKTTLQGNVVLDWYNWDTMAAAGGIISSVGDMTKWIRLQLREGKIDDKRRLFSVRSSRQMWRPHTLLAISEKYRKMNPSTHFRAYGLGWAMRDYKGKKIISHGGGYDGMYSRVVLVPEEELGFVVLTNSMTSLPTAACNRILDEFLGGDKPDWSKQMLADFKADRQRFHDRVVAATTPALADTSPSLPLKKYTGSYRDKMLGDATVKLVDDNLVLGFEINPDLVADLRHMHLDTFEVRWRREFAWFDGGNLQFDIDGRAKVAGFGLDIPNDDLWFYELDFKRVP